MVKVLFAGDVQGRLGALADKVEALNASKHGPFDAVFCVGEFFPPQGRGASKTNTVDLEDFVNGSRRFPIPLYFVAGKYGHEKLQADGCELGANLCFLGKCGVKSIGSLDDLKIVFLSGAQTNAKKSANKWQYTDNDVDALATVLKSEQESTSWSQPDLLLTCEWPADSLLNLEETQLPYMAPSNAVSTHVKTLCVAATPRYHFVGKEGLFYARPPFRNGLQAATTVLHEDGSQPGFTRMIALGRVDPANQDKNRKWLHALALEPQWKQKQQGEQEKVPELAPCPFAPDAVAKAASVAKAAAAKGAGGDIKTTNPSGKLTQAQIQRLHAQDAAENSQYFFGSKRKRKNDGKTGRRTKRKRRNNVAPRPDCWYCLASPSCETHLIVSLAEDVYLSLPKGSLSAQHVQIVPIGHEESFAALEESSLLEALKFKQGIKDFYASFDCVPLFFERNVILLKAMQRHAFLEAIPLPMSSTPQIFEALKREADRCKVSFDEELPDLTPADFPELPAQFRSDGLVKLKAHMGDSAQEYLFIEVPGILSPRLHLIPEDPSMVDEEEEGNNAAAVAAANKTDPAIKEARKRIPLEFGRQLACSLLRCMHRVSWKDCIVPQDLETRMATAFKDGFKPFDPFQEAESN
mmetsp:Transcript_2471/g.5657  ORF Transcript_2471/g.5657 Transcript_2471/m.5657 type:complete len:636 (+) Transcript_2471:114-2021(+)